MVEAILNQKSASQKIAAPVGKGKPKFLHFFVRGLIVFLLIGLALAILFDSSRSLLNINNISDQESPISSISSISRFFNPIKPETREFLASRITRSIILLFFSLIFLQRAIRHFQLQPNLKKNLVAIVFFVLFLINIVIYFAWLTTDWTYIFILSGQIFLLIGLDYLFWILIGKKADKINYNYKKLLLFKHISLASLLFFFTILFAIFGSMVFSEQKKVTYENPIAEWLYTFITEVGKVKNFFILIAILVLALIFLLMAFSPQIYFYKQTYHGFKRQISSLSVFFFVFFAILAYHIYVNIFALTNFVQFLPFGKHLNPNYLPMIIGISVLVLLASIYLVFNLTNLNKKIKDYRISFFSFFLLASFIVSFVSGYLSLTIYETIWLNLTQLVYFILIYIVFVRSQPEIALWLKVLIVFFISFYALFSLIFLVNIDVYTSAVTKVDTEKDSGGLATYFYIDYSFYFYGILATFLAIFSFADLIVAIAKNILIIKSKKVELPVVNQLQDQEISNKNVKKQL